MLHRAASRRNLLEHGNPVDFAIYAAPYAVRWNVAPHLVRSDASTLRCSVNPIVDGADAPPGFVYLINNTIPGTLIVMGLFHLYSYIPVNVTNPYYFNYYTFATYVNQPVAVDIMYQSNRDVTPVRWTRVAPRNTARAPSSVIAFGGPIHHPNATNVLDRMQYLGVNDRGEVMGAFFSTLMTNNGSVALLADVATGAFVAGNIRDATANIVNGKPVLVPLNNVTDPQVLPIIAAATTGSHGNLFLTCPPPCTYTYWPRSNVLLKGSAWSRARDHVLFESFQVIRVVNVSDELGLNMRVIVVVPSGAILEGLEAGVLAATIAPSVVVACVGLLCAVLMWWMLRSLREVEDVLDVMSTMRLWLQQAQSHSQPEEAMVLNSSESALIARLATSRSKFPELYRIEHALVRLINELKLLRAFSAAGAAATLMDTSSTSCTNTPGESPNHSTEVNHCHEVETAALSIEDSAITPSVPYNMKTLWRVPVTAACGVLAGLDPLTREPSAILRMHTEVLNTIHLYIARHAGAMIDSFSGDSFTVHYNAAHRSPRHALTAVEMALDVVVMLPSAKQTGGVTLRWGISTLQATCGLMGPNSLRRFTVVSKVDAHAAMMAHLAVTEKLPCLLTWRSAELLRQQDTAAQQRESQRWPVALAVAVLAVLPGETAITGCFKVSVKRRKNAPAAAKRVEQ